MSLLENKKKVITLLAAFALLFAALPAFAAQRLELWNGEIKKGDISVRANGNMQEAAIDELISALGFAPKRDPASIIVTLDGKKIEFWNASNVVRAAGAIISFPLPVSVADGHWWGETKSLLTAFDHFYRAIGKPSSFRWGEASAAAPQPVKAEPTAAEAAPQPKSEEPPMPVKAEVEPKEEKKPQPIAIPKAEPRKDDADTGKSAAVPFTGSKRPIVVVDAGHGGHDPGAVANGVREKDINLKAAARLAELLRQQGVDARLTRGTDVYLKLAERTAFANKNDASVFVSLHCNAMPKGKSGVAGFEIYIMALPSDKDAMNLAIAENREISGGASNAKEVQQNADRKTQLLLKILGDMQQNDKINESTALTEVLHQSARSSGLPMRKVAQAPFFVLRGAGMPAVLVEMGYLTNAAEARKLNSASYRDQICRSLAQGIVRYIREHPVM
ncbi:MAG: N-acetylmuramoyl-L-alanine amidase [Synergistaceae bacterium]|nr:N-acetylmuramoyl-L-alanine amidase [Synergistaceae bacterium]